MYNLFNYQSRIFCVYFLFILIYVAGKKIHSAVEKRIVILHVRKPWKHFEPGGRQESLCWMEVDENSLAKAQENCLSADVIF